MRLRFPSIIAGLAVGATSLQAQSYNFNSFATHGQSFQGVTLGPMTLSSSNGTLIYTTRYGGGLFDNNAATSDITMTFLQAVSALTIRGGDGGGDLDAFGLLLYEFGTNNLLGSLYSPQFGGPNEPEWYTMTVSGLGNIGRAVFDPCNSGVCPGNNALQGGVVITDIDITTGVSVAPEPSTVVLMLSGLAAVGLVARRRRS